MSRPLITQFIFDIFNQTNEFSRQTQYSTWNESNLGCEVLAEIFYSNGVLVYRHTYIALNVTQYVSSSNCTWRMKLIIESSTYNHSECGVEEEINDKTIGVGFRGL